jgi:ribose transport system substrate-binding protein
LIAAGFISLAACSSGSGDASETGAKSSPGITAAKDFLDKHIENPNSIGIDEPLSADIPSGKSVVFLRLPFPVAARASEANAAAAKVLGWDYTAIDAGATPATAVSAFDAAIAKKPDAIIFGGYPASLFVKQIKQANAAGIVVESFSTGDGPTSGVLADLGLKDQDIFGQLSAAYFVANAGTKGKAVMFTLASQPILTAYTDSFVKYVKKWCPTCETKIVDQQVTDVGTKTPGNVVSFLQRNPSFKWAAFANGDLAGGVSAAIKTAGIKDVKIFGEVPTAANLENVAAGTEASWVGFPIDIQGWRVMDILARHFVGDDLTAAIATPLPGQVITAENVKTVASDSKGQYVAVDGYADQFKKLWTRD